MQAESRRAKVLRLGSELQRSNDHNALTIKELLALQLDEVKDSLMTARGEDLIRAQGEAQAIDRLLTLVTRPAPKMQQRKTQEH